MLGITVRDLCESYESICAFEVGLAYMITELITEYKKLVNLELISDFCIRFNVDEYLSKKELARVFRIIPPDLFKTILLVK